MGKTFAKVDLVSSILIFYSLGVIFDWLKGSSWGNLLFMLGKEEAWIHLLERAAVAALLISTLMALRSKSLYWAVVLSLFYGFHSYSGYWAGGRSFGELSFLSSLAKVLLPWIFYLYCQGRWAEFKRLSILFTGVVFFTHGLMAILGQPKFVDYLLMAWEVFTGGGLQEESAKIMLIGIGVLDLLVAILLLIRPTLLGIWNWIVFWAFATTFLRFMFGGWGNISEIIIRIPHILVPLLFVLRSVDEPQINKNC